jgi:rhodanese-related sulfurtransferase
VANHLGVPGYSVEQVAALRRNGDAPPVLDVREPAELTMAALGPGVLLCPMSELAARGVAALPAELTADPTAPVIVMCHHGVRSAQVVAWLRANGFEGAMNMDGGIDAYAREVDPSIGSY